MELGESDVKDGGADTDPIPTLPEGQNFANTKYGALLQTEYPAFFFFW